MEQDPPHLASQEAYLQHRIKQAMEPLPQEVCPSKENPLSWWHRFGWSLMHQRIWPDAILHNPIIYYLTRRKWGPLLEDLFSLVFWFAVLAAEGSVLYISYVNTNLEYFLLWVLLELMFLPLLIGVWAQLFVMIHYYRMSKIMRMEELVLTRIRLKEIMAGLTIRPILFHTGSAMIFSIISLVGFITVHSVLFTGQSLYSGLHFFLIYVVLGYRVFVFKSMVEFAAVIAIRACMFIPDFLSALIRAIRDWIYPWGLIPIIFPFIMASAFIIQSYTGGIFFYLMILTPLLGLYFLFVFPSFLKDYEEETLYWVLKRSQLWALTTGRISEKVPKSLLSSWKLSRRAGSRDE